MKIDVTRTSPTRPLETAKEPKRAVASANSTGSDEIVISPAAKLLRKAMTLEEPFDAAKVADLKAKLADGHYTVDTDRLAMRLAGELMLLARGTK